MTGDGYPEIYISNDFEARDYYYVNNRNGTFTLATSKFMKHTSNSSMGSDLADYNNDGLLDLFVVDMLAEDRHRQVISSMTPSVYSPVYDSSQIARNTLQLNRGEGTFSDVAPMAGVSATDWSWAALFADFDLDGFKDLYIDNGFRRDLSNADTAYRISPLSSDLEIVKQFGTLLLKHYAYRNNGDLTFSKVSASWPMSVKFTDSRDRPPVLARLLWQATQYFWTSAFWGAVSDNPCGTASWGPLLTAA